MFSACGGLLVASNPSGAVRVWNTSSGQPAAGPLPGHGTVTGARPQPGRQNPGRGGQQRAAVADSGRPADRRRTAACSHGSYRAVAFSPDGTMLATFGADGTARIWAVATQREIGAPMTAGLRRDAHRGRGVQPRRPGAGRGGRRGPGPAVERGHRPAARAAHGHGRSHVRGGVQRGRQDAGDRGRRRQRPALERSHPAGNRHPDDGPRAQPVYAAAFSPSGSTLATASGDGSARLWNAWTAPGRPIPRRVRPASDPAA